MSLNRVWIPSPNYSSRGGSGVRLVVVHTAEGARNFRDLGSFFSSSSVQASSHVGIDDERGSIGEYVSPSNKAWTQASYNPQCVSSELCAAPIHSSYPCGANWTADEWNLHDGMLQNAADWIREECNRYGLPIEKLETGVRSAGIRPRRLRARRTRLGRRRALGSRSQLSVEPRPRHGARRRARADAAETETRRSLRRIELPERRGRSAHVRRSERRLGLVLLPAPRRNRLGRWREGR